MRLWCVWSGLAFAGLGACLFPDLAPLAASDAGDASADTPPQDAGVCDPNQPFTKLVAVDELNGEGLESFRAALTPDELQVWYAIRDVSEMPYHIMHATRADRSAPFGASVLESAIDSLNPVDPTVSPDGLTLVFSAVIANKGVLYRATRTSTTSAFGAGTSLLVATADSNSAPFLAFDGSLWFSSYSNGNDIVVSAAGAGGFVSTPSVVKALSSSASDDAVTLTHDGLTAYVSSQRTDLPNAGGQDVFIAHRTSTLVDFGPLTNATELDSAEGERTDWISEDNCRLYFESSRVAGVARIYLATKSP